MSHRRKGNGHNGHGGRVIQGDVVEFDVIAPADGDPYEGSCNRCARQGQCERGEGVALMVAAMREKAVSEGRTPGEMVSGCDEFQEAIDNSK